MASKFEEALTKAIEDGTAAGAAAIAVDKTGSALSCSSTLLTTICILQCVERGAFALDDPVSKTLKEFETCTIITGMDGDKPIIEPSPRCPTLRELLTHSSGCTYTAMHPILSEYWTKHLGREPDVVNNNVIYQHSNPLVFAPGTAWAYGCGVDWAGVMVERVSGQRLEAYMKEHIFDPLSMPLSTFHPTRNPDFMAKLAIRPMRHPETGKLVPDTTGTYPIIDPDDDLGGAGLYSSAPQYIKVLASLLANDGRLLTPNSRAELLRPCLSPEAEAVLNMALSGPFAPFLAPGYSVAGEKAGKGGEEVHYSYAIGGGVVVNEGGIGGLADPGLVYWSGLPNCNWFIDVERGVAGVYIAHLMPAGDKPTQDLYRAWHEAVYKMVGQ
ncbi:uncharacterized protein HMPREF1541_02384 [Cyphellophora europaea CBS 101466]|uniref:Beta-lactamase-related domain-containing protein n=1 Tax=Cyphellophora europaea (strain CBS 101466) TaxID=1220924 RepID=W2S3P5_CYPE1|nr:uncharacterized protein HMPREF1541_02384 [Cyphellophora europaea CBS 101466]ETN43225.1 hypothetical protein HMPREF1541_02384 [Cyphellophora europaea CBS 101466]